MTILAPLPVHGLATPYVESIWSYVARIAKVHGVRPKDIHELVRNFCPDSTHKFFGGQRNRSMGGWLAGYSPNACSYVKRLSVLTGQEHCWALSLARLHGQLARNVTGCITPSLRWCPVCIGESKEKTIEPLLWQISLVDACPIHSVQLISRCGQCGAERQALLSNAGSGVCGRCSGSLSSSAPTLVTLTPYQKWQQHQILDLLAYTSDPDEPNPVENGMAVFMKSLHWTSEPQSRQMDFSARLILQESRKAFRSHGHLPRLETLLDMAGALGVTLKQIFISPAESASQPLDVGPNEKHKLRRRRTIDPIIWQSACLAARTWLAKDNAIPMPTLTSLCRRMGATAHGIHERDNKLYLAYNEKWRLQKSIFRDALFDKLVDTAFAYINECNRNGTEPQIRAGARAISKIVGGSKMLSEAAMHTALNSNPFEC